MQELYDIACETNLMLAPSTRRARSSQSAQLAARDFFGPLGDVEQFPQSFVDRALADGEAAPVAPAAPRPRSATRPRARRARLPRATGGTPGRRAWDGVKILEFGSGAAGPIATRYFVEHGATVLRIESKTPARLPARDGRSGPTTRTGSRARRCTTGSTSASATSRST